jgi:LuxR family maltose regulon positive regulatory protein
MAEAVPLLDRLLEAAQSMGRQGDAIRYLVLQALALHTAGDMASALASLSQALTLAEPEGYVRIFVDEGEPMAALLAQAAAQDIAPDYASTLLAAFPEQVRQDVEFTVAAPAVSQPLIEPLSERELEVLRLMAAGLKQRQVAEELVISLNTVRHHARNIYGKLDVHSRAQAVAKAKDLSLL